jgi:hypothetical protein
MLCRYGCGVTPQLIAVEPIMPYTVISQFELPPSLNLNCRRQRKPGEVEKRPKMIEKIRPRGSGGHFLGFSVLKETLALYSRLLNPTVVFCFWPVCFYLNVTNRTHHTRATFAR